MTDRGALSLGLKITGFAWLLRCVYEVYLGMHSLSFIKTVQDGERLYSDIYVFRAISNTVIVVIVTIVLLAFSDKLSRLIVRKEKPLSEQTIFGAAVALVGIIFVSLAIESLFASIMSALEIGENRTALSVLSVGWRWAYVVEKGAILLAGLYLACCRQHIVNLTTNWQKYLSTLRRFFSLNEPG